MKLIIEHGTDLIVEAMVDLKHRQSMVIQVVLNYLEKLLTEMLAPVNLLIRCMWERKFGP